MVASVGLGCRSGPQATPLNELNAQQMHGHEIFQARCSVCHYDRKDGVLHGPSLLGVFKKPACRAERLRQMNACSRRSTTVVG